MFWRFTMDYLFDSRGDCMSFLMTLEYPKYKKIVDAAYANKGGIEGQRDVLKASTAIRIRKRMIEDIIKGAILPPVVIGAVIGNQSFDNFKNLSKEQLVSWLVEHKDVVSLIDGMQRTTALMAAEKEAQNGLANYKLRVEVWLAKSVNRLIYRMLILNTGQVPWDIKRQLQTVFSSLLKKIKNDVPGITIYAQDDNKRRGSSTQYQASDILELYLVFGSRKEKIDIKERLSDEFVRLDFIEVTSIDESSDLFCDALSLLGRLDKCFGRYQNERTEVTEKGFLNGKDIFGSQPARAGFIAATAQLMLGRPGSTQSKTIIKAKWKEKEKLMNTLLEEIEQLEVHKLKDFLALDTLSEKLSNQKVPRIGDFEREFFKIAFRTMYEECDNLGSLEVCWNAY